jgi:hypothetical protein
MKKLIISLLVLLFFTLVMTSCATSRNNHAELRGLMLLENLQLGRNKAFYSKHNIKTRNEAYRKFKKNSRNL